MSLENSTTSAPLSSASSGFGTRAVHAGMKADPSTGAIMTPIYQTSTYQQQGPGVHKGYAYGRGQNPTRSALQEALAELEEARHAVCFASGMAATDAVLKLLRPGDEVLITHDLYGGSYRIFMQVFAHYGIRFRRVDMSSLEELERKATEYLRMLWIETPTNPLMSVIDIQALASWARARGVLSVVDNTFASPYLQRPLTLGADLVVHSATKYLGGHSDLLMGCVAMNDQALFQQISFLQNACGAIPGPQDCFLTLRGLKTLHLRMRAHCENGRAIAHFLRDHPQVGKVHWPGFEDHPGHEVAKRQMLDFGGMLSFDLQQQVLAHAYQLMQRTRLFTLAESLGGVESLIGHPASMTHASIPEKERLATGITDTLIRLSVGVEDAQDLIHDLDQALASLPENA